MSELAIGLQSPCKGCENRCVTLDYNCHTHCEAFLEYKARGEAVKDARRLEKSIWTTRHQYQIDFAEKRLRRRRR